MANPEHLAILKQGPQVWNAWWLRYTHDTPHLGQLDLLNPDFASASLRGFFLRGVNLFRSNLSQVDLRDADLRDSDFREADLVEADLSNANLSHANFAGANLLRANLSHANLSSACFDGAILSGSIMHGTLLVHSSMVGSFLIGASLVGTILNGATIKNADFRGALVGSTSFVGLDLGVANGLEAIRHTGPSIVSIDTIFGSQARLSDVFLRGCGVPEYLITLRYSPAGKDADFHSCFISHSADDKRFCDRLYADLQARNVRVWYFPEDATWGESVWSEIDKGIRSHDKLVIILSENSLQSGPVLREIERALSREDKEHKNVLFPITLDRYVFDTWEHPRKADLLSKFVGDFIGWDGDAMKYDKAFKRLLKGLQETS